MPSIAQEALLKANTQQNIVSGFNKSGIFQYNPDVFQDHGFAPSFATKKDAFQEDVNVFPSIPPISVDITMSTNLIIDPDPIISVGIMSTDPARPVDTITSTDTTMSTDPNVAGSSLNSDAFHLLRIRPFQKKPARSEKRKRNVKKSSILTNTFPRKKEDNLVKQGK